MAELYLGEIVMEKVVFFMPEGAYSTTRFFTHRLGAAIEALGPRVEYLDFQELGVLEVMERVRSEPVDFTCTFNAILPLHDGSLFCDHLEIPHLNCLVDMSMDALYLLKSPYSVISCVDAFFCKYLQDSGFERAFFLPHAASEELEVLPEKEKCYDLLFMGTCFDPEAIAKPWPEIFSPQIAQILLDAATKVLSDNKTCHVFALFEALQKASFKPQDIPLVDLFQQFERYLKGRSRLELIKSLDGLDLHVFGDAYAGVSWEKVLSGRDNIHIHKAVDFDKALEVMAQSKIVLNSSPFFKYGAHERIFYGLSCGSCVFSDENIFLKKCFSEELFLYRPWELKNVREQLQRCLEQPQKRQEAALRGREKVLQEHSWEKRARVVLDQMAGLLKGTTH